MFNDYNQPRPPWPRPPISSRSENYSLPPVNVAPLFAKPESLRPPVSSLPPTPPPPPIPQPPSTPPPPPIPQPPSTPNNTQNIQSIIDAAGVGFGITGSNAWDPQKAYEQASGWNTRGEHGVVAKFAGNDRFLPVPKSMDGPNPYVPLDYGWTWLSSIKPHSVRIPDEGDVGKTAKVDPQHTLRGFYVWLNRLNRLFKWNIPDPREKWNTITVNGQTVPFAYDGIQQLRKWEKAMERLQRFKIDSLNQLRNYLRRAIAYLGDVPGATAFKELQAYIQKNVSSSPSPNSSKNAQDLLEKVLRKINKTYELPEDLRG